MLGNHHHHALALVPIALAGGSWIVLGGLIIGFFVVIPLAYYTRKGSGIYQHEYGKVYGGAPGASTPSQVSGRDIGSRPADWSRGTR